MSQEVKKVAEDAATADSTALVARSRAKETTAVIEEDNTHLLAHFECLKYPKLTAQELVTLLETHGASREGAKPIWIEIENAGALGSTFIVVNAQRSSIAYALPPDEIIHDQLGVYASPDQGLGFFSTQYGLPLSEFLAAIKKVDQNVSLIAAISTARQIIANKYRRSNNLTPLSSVSFLTLEGLYGAKSVLIEHALVIPEGTPGNITEEMMLMVTTDFQPLEKIIVRNENPKGEILGEDDVGILLRIGTQQRWCKDIRSYGDHEYVTFLEKNNQVPLYTAVFRINPQTGERELSTLETFRYYFVGETFGKNVLKCKHLQISTNLSTQTIPGTDIRGVTLKNETRTVHLLRGSEAWSSRFGDYIEADDLWATVSEERNEYTDELVAKIIAHIVKILEKSQSESKMQDNQLPSMRDN